jgi:hypothetical protein
VCAMPRKGLRAQGANSRAQGADFRAQGADFRAQAADFCRQGANFRAQAAADRSRFWIEYAAQEQRLSALEHWFRVHNQ